MPIPEERLRKLSAAPTPPPDHVDPRLPLGEEVVLLSLHSSRRKVRRAVALAARVHGEPNDYRTAVNSLQGRGLVQRSGPRRKLEPTPEAKVDARRHRVVAVIRHPASPAVDDAELLVLLAFSGALPLSQDDHLRARHRISSIGSHDDVPAVVELVRRDRNVESMRELAEVLLPPKRDFHIGDFDPGMTEGAEAGAGYTTTGPGPGPRI